jgi:hypothetical protein
VLKGERVLLRPVRRSDIQHLLKWFNDPEVTRYVGAYLPTTGMAGEKWFEDLQVKATSDGSGGVIALGAKTIGAGRSAMLSVPNGLVPCLPRTRQATTHQFLFELSGTS